jgi:hypothetical protein
MQRTAFTALAAAAVATGALSIPAADAATLEQLISQNFQFTFEDDSAEDIGNDENGNGSLDQGDTLRGVFSFPFFNNTVTGERFSLDGTTNSAVHGVFEAEVATKSSAGDGVFNYTFEPYGPFAQRVDGPDGAMIALYESAEPLNPFNCGDKDACEAAATNGDLRLVLGFEDGTGDWTAGPAPDNLEAARTVAQADNIAPYDFELSVLENNVTSLDFINVPGFETEVIGSGQILGSAESSSPFPTFDDADIQMSVVPVPAALPLFLAGLGALGMIGWRRNAA